MCLSLYICMSAAALIIAGGCGTGEELVYSYNIVARIGDSSSCSSRSSRCIVCP